MLAEALCWARKETLPLTLFKYHNRCHNGCHKDLTVSKNQQKQGFYLLPMSSRRLHLKRLLSELEGSLFSLVLLDPTFSSMLL